MTVDNSAIGDNAGVDTEQHVTPPEADEYQLVSHAPEDTIESFIDKLSEGWEYPTDAHTGDTPPAVIDQQVTPPEDEEDDDPDDPLVPEPDATPDPNATPTTAIEPETVKVNGVAVPLADVQRLYEFDQFLRSNPDASQRVAAAISNDQPTPAAPAAEQPTVPAQTPAPAAPASVTPPDFLDLEDPAQKFLWDSHVATQTELATIRQQGQQQAQALADRQAQVDASEAIAKFRTDHPNFNDDQITTLRQHAAQMNIVGSLLATSPTPVAALHRNLELAALDHADSRTLFLAAPDTSRTPTREQHSRRRKSALNAIGGGGGAVPKTNTAPKPQTDRQAIDEFARQLAETYQSN